MQTNQANCSGAESQNSFSSNLLLVDFISMSKYSDDLKKKKIVKLETSINFSADSGKKQIMNWFDEIETPTILKASSSRQVDSEH